VPFDGRLVNSIPDFDGHRLCLEGWDAEEFPTPTGITQVFIFVRVLSIVSTSMQFLGSEVNYATVYVTQRATGKVRLFFRSQFDEVTEDGLQGFCDQCPQVSFGLPNLESGELPVIRKPEVSLFMYTDDGLEADGLEPEEPGLHAEVYHMTFEMELDDKFLDLHTILWMLQDTFQN
jgi:hypothetical protein